MSNTPLIGVLEMSNEDHHAHPAIGSSGLKLVRQSPLHYWAAYLDPDREKREATDAMKLGTAVHTCMLEPEKIPTAFGVVPEGIDKRSKDGKALFAEIEAGGRIAIKQAEFDRALKMAAAAHAHPVSRVLFGKCKARTETSIFWVDPETGVNCKIRPDIMVEPCAQFPNGLIADLKTTEDASPSEFGRSVWNWEMYLQAFLYPEGFMQTFGTKKPPQFLWLAQEKQPPYANKYYPCGQSLSAYGEAIVRDTLEIVAECQSTGIWPGYSTAVEPLIIPGWAEKIMNDELNEANEIEVNYASQ
jgi:hypothetical protein